MASCVRPRRVLAHTLPDIGLLVFLRLSMEKAPMRTFLALATLVAMFLGSLVRAQEEAVATSESPIADEKLEAAVRATLKLDADAELNEETLRKLYLLEARDAGIKDLKGLELCRNLSLLNLARNEVADLGPLADLENLQSLDLSKNHIKNIEPLSGLTRLQYLELTGNEIENIGPLAPLEKLSALYLSQNQIEDIAPLKSLNRLSSLYLAENQLEDITPLAEVNRLSTLDLRGNSIKDVSPLAYQTDLRMLFLQENKVEDLSPLVEALKEDAEGPRRMAPYLRLYLSEEDTSEAIEELKALGVRINPGAN